MGGLRNRGTDIHSHFSNFELHATIRCMPTNAPLALATTPALLRRSDLHEQISAQPQYRQSHCAASGE
jgi:hypothetical protein